MQWFTNRSVVCYHTSVELHDEQKVNAARKLRKQGLSFRKIGQELSIDEKCVRAWCFNIPSSDPMFLAAEKKRSVIRSSEKEIGFRLKIDKDLAKLLASFLYWGEGTKYPNSTAVSFSNSDPVMIKLFVRLLRFAFPLDEAKFRIHLQLHTIHDKTLMFEYWSKLLDIPIDQFWKPTVTAPTQKMKRQSYFGTCTVRYHDYKILLKLIGIYENIVPEIEKKCKE